MALGWAWEQGQEQDHPPDPHKTDPFIAIARQIRPHRGCFLSIRRKKVAAGNGVVEAIHRH